MLIRSLVVLFACLFIHAAVQAQTDDTKSLSYDARLTNYEYAWAAKTFAFTSQNQKL